tara:strand:+ start:377 stop:613 length:237 start_codon:yes stop_codon:yes gene_type:complete
MSQPKYLPSRAYKISAKDKVFRDLRRFGPSRMKQIADRTGLATGTISLSLRKHQGISFNKRTDGKWEVVLASIPFSGE